ncbi:DUF3795 domain-containing protein [uncultured Desulfosarcina sp.]|uniref:DUF3795 domain-containing protein n=1 Tax=uncultured Desulfosarcina sp. TaxID=218289 RepID=UPI0029C96E2B|nr:DUF3795 domain-containing protein [uncultured Desulfosarcina sp.]
MNYSEILDFLAPCGSSCRKCFAFAKGDIAFHSTKLQELVGHFDVYAERFSTFLPVFTHYPQFKEMLAYFADPDCKGCRQGTCKYPNCGVVDCYEGKGVDFCFQCDDFPCNKTNFDPHLEKRWRQMNMRMKEIGVEAYYEETKDLCRYL